MVRLTVTVGGWCVCVFLVEALFSGSKFSHLLLVRTKGADLPPLTVSLTAKRPFFAAPPLGKDRQKKHFKLVWWMMHETNTNRFRVSQKKRTFRQPLFGNIPVLLEYHWRYLPSIDTLVTGMLAKVVVLKCVFLGHPVFHATDKYNNC